MNDDLNIHDDALLDRLVDGELSPAERREFLVALEAHPEGWRRCALAFLEAQTWRSQLRRATAAQEPAITDGSTSVGAAPDRDLAARPPRSGWRRNGAWLAVAAGLLLAFGLGAQMNRLNSGSSAESRRTEFAAIQSPAAPAAPAIVRQPPVRGDAVMLVVNDHRGVPQRVEVPLVEGRHLGRQFAETPQWTSPELDRRLDEQGLELTARRRYAPLYFEQQNQRIPFIVPVDDAVVTPVSRPVF